jgi:hypothetical protein
MSLSSCAYRLGDLTIASTRNYEQSQKYELAQRQVEGRDMRHWIIIFPTGMPNIEEAMDDAINKADGEYMTNAALYLVRWYIPLIYGQYGFQVKGDVYRKVAAPAP